MQTSFSEFTYFKQVIDDTDRKAAQRDEAKKLLAKAKKLRREKK